MPFPLLLALRFFGRAIHEKTLNSMLKICFISIFIGTGSLTLIAAIMNGFEQATHRKLQGIHADLVISTYEHIDYPRLKTYLEKHFSQEILAASPSSIHNVILQKKTPNGTQQSICLLKSVDPETEPLVSSLGEMITQSSSTPWHDLKNDHLFIGEPVAQRLQVTVGSDITLLYQKSEDDTQLHKKKVTIVGLYKTGIQDYDEQIIIAPFALVDSLYEKEVTHVALALRNQNQEQAVKSALQEKLSLSVYSWKDLYTPLMAALTLEKYAMWVILLLVTLVAALTIVALLSLYSNHKQQDIALLIALGMETTAIRQMLLWIAIILTFSATTMGVLAATAATWFLQNHPFIRLPDVYYVTHLPAVLDSSIIFGVYLVAVIVSFFAGFFPPASISRNRITGILKGLNS